MNRKSPHCVRPALAIGLLVIPSFAHADTWHDYICSLHDDLGMRGQVVVVW